VSARVVAVLAARPTAVRAAGRAASLPPTKGYFVSRPWSRVGVRSASVGLLVAGLIGGVYLGKDRVVQAPQQRSEASNVVQVDVDDMQLLKQRQSQHAAARAYQRQAEGDAAAKAATEAKAAADKAHDLETKAIAAKKAAADAAAKKKSEDSGGPVAYNGPIPTSCNEYTGSRKTGCALMLEAGFKIDAWNRRLRVNGAAFYNKYKDLQVGQFVAPSAGGGGGALTFNANAKYKGFELETAHGQAGTEFLPAPRNIDEFTQPRQRDSHQPALNCARKRRSFSKNRRRSLTP